MMYNYSGYHNYDPIYYGFLPFHMLGFVFMFVFWGAIIWVLFHFIRNNKHTIRHSSSTIEILKERYAKGEITKEEFKEMKKNLEEKM